jgi:hypothetical protein
MPRATVILLFALLAIFSVTSDLAAQQATGSNNAGSPQPVFEMRTYTTHEGRLDALIRRFRDHTTRLFEKHGMVNIGYWVPQDSPLSANTLIYVLQYPSREAAVESWAAFRGDPEWQEVSRASQEDGTIVDNVVSVFMDPTDFSAIR